MTNYGPRRDECTLFIYLYRYSFNENGVAVVIIH